MRASATASIRDRKYARISAEMSSRILLLSVKLAATRSTAPEMFPPLPASRVQNRPAKIRAAVSDAIFAAVVDAIVVRGAVRVKVGRVEKAVEAPRAVATPAEIAGATTVVVTRLAAGAAKEISKEGLLTSEVGGRAFVAYRDPGIELIDELELTALL